MLETLKEKLQEAVRRLSGKGYVDERAIEEFIRDIERALLVSDVRVEDVLSLSERIRRRSREEPPTGVTRREHLIKIAYEELVKLLGEKEAEIEIRSGKQTRIMLIGLQGSGKTTMAVKLARYLKSKGYDVGVVCTDTYRRGAQEQLEDLSRKAEVDCFVTQDKDLDKIVKEASRKLAGKEVLIFDTAGRHKNEHELLREMEWLKKAIKPDLTLLIVDAGIGQQAYAQAKAFHEKVPVGGVIVTKMDGTARGGGALSATVATGAKVLFIGTGEKLDDLEKYDPVRFVSRLLGRGDLGALLERIEKTMKREGEDRVRRIVRGKFTLVDVIEQLQEMRKLGSIRRILDLLPIKMGKLPVEKLDELERKLERWSAALNSMTEEEKLNPEIIDSGRIRRISKGSGVEEREIREMIRQYRLLKRMIKTGRGRRLLRRMREFGGLDAY